MIRAVPTLRDVVKTLDELDDEATIYTDGGSPAAQAAIVADAAGKAAAEEAGLRYFLEVALAKDAVQVWSDWRQGRAPTLDDELMAIAYYARNDAYLPLD